MKRLRILILLAVMAAVAVPAYPCSYCNVSTGICVFDPEAGVWCVQGYDYCYDDGVCFAPAGSQSLAAEFTIASVEVETPAGTRIEENRESVQTAEVIPPQR